MTNDRITGPCPDCERTRAENARLREALEQICAKEFWYDSEGYCAAETMQSIARESLEAKP